MKMRIENKAETKRNVLLRKEILASAGVLRIFDAQDKSKESYTDFDVALLSVEVRQALVLWGLYEKLSDSKAGDKPATYNAAIEALNGKWESLLKGDLRVNTPREAGKAKAELATAKADKAKLEADNEAKQAQIDSLQQMMKDMQKQMMAMQAARQGKADAKNGKAGKDHDNIGA
jgi:hypothetical protein